VDVAWTTNASKQTPKNDTIKLSNAISAPHLNSYHATF